MNRIERTKEVLAYSNKHLSLFDDEVRFPNGLAGTYLRAAWAAPYSVAVLPVTPEKNFLLIKQFNYAVGEWVVQVPKGMGDCDLTPEQVARRELREETGCEA